MVAVFEASATQDPDLHLGQLRESSPFIGGDEQAVAYDNTGSGPFPSDTTSRVSGNGH